MVEAEKRVGAVEKKVIATYKDIIQENSMSNLIGGGILVRIDKRVNENFRNHIKERQNPIIKDAAMFAGNDNLKEELLQIEQKIKEQRENFGKMKMYDELKEDNEKDEDELIR